jgi:membrane dipeptidase
MFLFDAHLDLSMNAMEWNRDLRLPIEVLREWEAGMQDKPDRSRGTVCFPELRKGGIGLVVATQIARFTDRDNRLLGWHSPEQAWAQTQAQLAWYREMERIGELVQIRDLVGLERHLAKWEGEGVGAGLKINKHIGYILSLEGADSIVDITYLEKAYGYGLRALGPAHYGPGRYANGTDSSGRLGARGIELLKKMDELGIILDATHLCDDAFWQALGIYSGPVWASHNNCRALVDHNRQFSDEMIKALVLRGAVIGAALDAWMLVPRWERGVSDPLLMNCDLGKVVDHIDHICQIAGSSLHAGIGSDLDGAFGREQSPYDLATIADLVKIAGILERRGYGQEDIEGIMGRNWLKFLMRAWG